MKCKKCGAKASVNMRQHKLALCKEHYLEWVPEQTERFIKKYEMFSQHEKILVAVSGGKDSLWSVGYSCAVGLPGGWAVSRFGDRWRDRLLARIAAPRPKVCRRAQSETSCGGYRKGIWTVHPGAGRNLPPRDMASRVPCAAWPSATR